MGGTPLGVFLMPHVHGMGTVASCLLSWVCHGCSSANEVLVKGGTTAQHHGTLTYFGCFQFPSAVQAMYVAWALSPLVCCPRCTGSWSATKVLAKER